jgi:hypothetical protein
MRLTFAAPLLIAAAIMAKYAKAIRDSGAKPD